MIPKEKAVELHDKYYKTFETLGLDEQPNQYAIQHALICVDEMIGNSLFVNGSGNPNYMYWVHVKLELERMTS